jgi:hypothetical protein
MANGHGGYRQPSHPAHVSGPGSLSRRTDGGPAQVKSVAPGLPYGDQKQVLASESLAPMAGNPAATPTPTISAPPAASPAGGGPSAAPFLRPTERPGEPITHGVDIGPGAGPEVLPQEAQPAFQQYGPMTAMLSKLSASDATGALAGLLQFARAAGA